MPSNVEAKISALDRWIWSKETWVEQHGKKRPAHEVEIKEADLEIMRDIRNDYSLSLERARERERNA
jgi:hypothetical protein